MNGKTTPKTSGPADEKAFTLGPLEAGPPCCPPEPHIEVADLNLFYGDNLVLNDVSLTLNKGCISALIGPSGCGKTSFLSCLNRTIDLIPGSRVEGEIRLEGQDIRAMNIVGLRRRVGMIFQKPNPFPLSIRRNLDLPLREHGYRSRRQRQQISELALRQVGLWEEVKDRLNAPAQSLSGGQQQRLCIARALALEPQILLFDEPCSALDPISTEVIENLIETLRNKLTVVVVTHNLAQARRIADYAAFFWTLNGSGQLVEAGPAASLFNQPTHHLTSAYINGRKG